MNQSLTEEHRLVVTPGQGFVGRSADVIMVIPHVPRESVAAAERLMDLCLDDGLDRKIMLRRVAYQLGEPLFDLPGFCLLVSHAAGDATLFAFGAVDVTLPVSGEHVSAAGHVTWVERRLTGLDGFAVASVGCDEPTPGSAILDLRLGVVSGTAARLVARAGASGSGRHPHERTQDTQPTPVPTLSRPRPMVPAAIAPTAAPPAAPAAIAPAPPVAAAPETSAPQPPDAEHPHQAAFEAVLLSPAPDAPSPRPLPTAHDDPRDEGVQVPGVVCSRGHFNDPDSAYCAACGISMLQRTNEFISALRPPLGVLIFDNGAVFSVDGDYVVGREPELDPAVVDGRARPLALNDADGAVSRVHAELRLDGWTVLLEDRGSSNGTFVSVREGEDWIRLRSGDPQVLSPGHRILFGRRTAIFESHVRPG